MSVKALDQKKSVIDALSRLLTPDAIHADPPTLERYARSTFGRGIAPIAVVHPQSSAQIQQILTVAREHGVSVHPISRGHNWGYGSAAATCENQIILDLGRMNRIIEVNVESAYAVVEPGVTQGQLAQYLGDHDLPLWMDATGAGLDTSLVGNILERGFGHSRYGERAANVCGMQIVLADGRVLDTGFAGATGPGVADRVYRYGIGPSLDGLFAQSNLGIVTKLGLWLTPRPDHFAAFFIAVPEPGDLGPLIDRLSPLRMGGLLQSAIHIGNDIRVLSGRMRYPWGRANGVTPLSAALRRELQKEHGIGSWSASGSIYGTAGTVRETVKALRRAVKPYRIKLVDNRRLILARRIQRPLALVSPRKSRGFASRLGELLTLLEPAYGLLQGQPTDQPLRGAAWRVRGSISDEPQDPLDIHAGLRWIAPVLPARGEAAQKLVGLMEPIFLKYGFDPMFTFTMINERALICVSNVAYDTREQAEAEAAVRCYEELSRVTMAAGYMPYRTGPGGWETLNDGKSAFWQVANQIKDALDPENTISPGRYGLGCRE